MECREYIIKWKELYEALYQIIENNYIDNYDYSQIYNIFQTQKILENHEEVILFLRLLVQISNNHHRSPNFFNKIERILQYFYSYIKQTFTNFEIFELFKSNKLIVLHLIMQNIIIIDENIVTAILYRSEKTNTKYHLFFYPEIRNFIKNQDERNKIEQELKSMDLDIYDNFGYFDNKRKIGENENYLCELIRSDSIENFLSYINRRNISITNATVKTSIFETNPFLIQNEPTLIEYAAFYGSIQIFQYLKINNVELKPSLWLYTIHGQNAEMIHLLEENNVAPPYGSYLNCLDESIKCHHNDFAYYFLNSYLVNEQINDYQCILKSSNFQLIPLEISLNSIFFDLCCYNYTTLVNLYIKPKVDQYQNMKIISKKNYKIFIIIVLH